MALTIGVGISLHAIAASDDLMSNEPTRTITPAKSSDAAPTTEENSAQDDTRPQKSMLSADSSTPTLSDVAPVQIADAASDASGPVVSSDYQQPTFSTAYEELPRDQTVRERPRPEVDALGVHLGGFYAYPSVRTSEIYDDNIFVTPSDKRGDFITEIAPELSLESNWNNHALNFDAGAAAGYYASHTGEDYVDYHFGTDGRLDLTRDDQLSAAFTYRHAHEDRSSPDDVQGKTPTEYDLYHGEIGDQNRFGRFTLKLDSQLNRYKYFDDEAENGTTIDNNDRDRLSSLHSVTLSYEIVPDYDAYVRASYNRQDYDSQQDDQGFDRSSQGFETVVGLAIDLGGVTRADIFAGYLTQFYQDSEFDTVSGPSFGGSLVWNPTGLTTVTATVSRTLQETTQVGAAGYFSTDALVNIDHELLRNLLLNAFGGFINNNYEGISRNDDIWTGGVGAEYLMNHYASIDLKYRYDTRDSSESDENYERNLILLSLDLKL